MALIRPAIDDVIRAGMLIEDARGRLLISELGRGEVRGFVTELWRWLRSQVEEANAERLDEDGEQALRTIARRILLSDDPVNEPMEIAQAGGQAQGRP